VRRCCLSLAASKGAGYGFDGVDAGELIHLARRWTVEMTILGRLNGNQTNNVEIFG
jgi:hypothetical protein